MSVNNIIKDKHALIQVKIKRFRFLGNRRIEQMHMNIKTLTQSAEKSAQLLLR